MTDTAEMIAALGGETITYIPYGTASRQFKAIITRRPTQPENTGGFQYGVNTMEAEFPRDAVNGVLAVQERKDKMHFKKSLDDAQETEFTVQKILTEDTGLVTTDGGGFRVLVQS